MNENADLSLLIKMLGMTDSDSDGQALVAIRKANAQVRKLGTTWEDLLRGKVTVIADPFNAGDLRAPPPVETRRPMRPVATPTPPPRVWVGYTPLYGNTYDIRDQLKALGAKFDGNVSVWMIPDSEMPRARDILFRHIQSQPSSRVSGSRTRTTSTRKASANPSAKLSMDDLNDIFNG